MKNKKNIIIVAIVLLAVIVGVVVNTSDKSDSRDNRDVSSKVFVTVPKAVGYNWFNRMEEGVKNFSKDTSIRAYQQGPSQFDAALQIQVLEDLIAQEIHVLSVVPFQQETLIPVLRKAKENGILIITHEAPYFEEALYDVEPFNNEDYGIHLMEELAKLMGEKGEYALYVGSLNSTTHKAWVDAALAYQKANYPNMTWIGDYVETLDDSKIAYDKTKEVLKKYPNIKGFQGSGALDIVGIGQALEEARISDSTFVVGTSIVSYSGELLKTGAIDLISGWDPADSGYAMNLVAKHILEGNKITNGMDLGLEGYNNIVLDGNTIYGQAWIDITKENMSEYDF